MAHDIFISYADENKEIADAVCAGLESKGLRCWYAARDVRKDEVDDDARTEAVDVAKLFLLIFTDASNGSPQTVREVTSAADTRTPIVPLRLSDAAPSDNLKYYLSGLDWVTVPGGNVEKAIPQLAKVCEERLRGASRRSGKPFRIIGAVLIVALLILAGVRLLGGSGGDGSSEAPGDSGTKTAELTCVLEGMTCSDFEAAYTDALGGLGGDGSAFTLTFYDQGGKKVSGSDTLYSVRLDLPKEAAGQVTEEDVIACEKALVLASFSGDEEAADKLAARLSNAYSGKELAVNEAVDGYMVFCNITQKGGRVTIEPME